MTAEQYREVKEHFHVLCDLDAVERRRRLVAICDGDVRAVRALAGLTTATFTDPTITPGVMVVKAVHLTELRTALDAARSALSLPAISYTNPSPTAGVSFVSAADINDLRTGVK
jgi:hypothetical protein